jgi:CubicO group peptidase (beta-lactamase class C family)
VPEGRFDVVVAINVPRRQRASDRIKPARLLLLAALILECGYRPPPDTGDGWRVGRAADAELNEPWLVAARLAARKPGSRIHSMLVVKDGRLVLEEYMNGWQRDSLHPMFSMTKSIVSLLAGVAVENGDLAGLGVPVSDFFPGSPGADQQLTVWHLLTHTAGLEWDEMSFPYGDSRNSQTAMMMAGDWAGFVLSRPRTAPPGSVFRYSTGNYFLLGLILEQATGMPLARFARERLFEPLGIERFEWGRNRQGQVCADGSWGGLRLRSRDLARIGQLVLDRGTWDGCPVVSSRWLDSATAVVAEARPGMGYGFGWWSYEVPVRGRKLKLVMALGYRSQALLLLPQERLAVVFTSDYANPHLNLIVASAGCILVSALGLDAVPLCLHWLRTLRPQGRVSGALPAWSVRTEPKHQVPDPDRGSFLASFPASLVRGQSGASPECKFQNAGWRRRMRSGQSLTLVPSRRRMWRWSER